METGRLEAFSDGVFAIAITLLILEVRLPPEDSGTLAHRLAQSWPGYVGFLISFITFGRSCGPTTTRSTSSSGGARTGSPGGT